MEFIALEFDTLIIAASVAGKITNALSVVLGLGAVIFFHELGHFAVAKWCDVHVERFSIGIGPIIWSRQKGETEYALSALPFGGYVKMLGQDDMDPNQMTSDEIAENPRAYSAKKVWQRMAIISAGVIMNVITGFLFFAIAFRSGVVELSPMIGIVRPGTPAWEAGLRDGDVIQSIDGEDVQNFMDINQSVVLSTGSVNISGEHADGTSFKFNVTPERPDTVRMIGIGPASTSRISPLIEDVSTIVMPGLPAADASQNFLPGDRIVAVNGQPVHFLHEMTDLTARFAADDIIYTVERTAESAGDDRASAAQSVDISVPPRKMKSLGLMMAIGPITSIVKGSIAEQAGLQVGDQIVKVGELEVSKDIDPLRLPNYFADNAGQEVEITVNRERKGDSNETLAIRLTPADVPGWSEKPLTISGPLPISAIGAGIRVLPNIAHVFKSDLAETSGGELKASMRITKVELQHPEGTEIVADVMGDKVAPEIIDLTEDETSKATGEPNWAWVFFQIQSVPDRWVRLHVANGSEEFVAVFKDNHFEDDWYLPIRGISGWEENDVRRKADSWGEAFSLGVRHTKSSGINIYLTLRSLFQRHLSVKALSGPLGIVNIGYKVAEDGFSKLLMFLGFLSINLAVLNFLPIPVLDGGHMVFLIWEAIARRKPSPRVINWAHGFGLIFIISLFVFVMYLDIFVNRFGSGG